MKRVFKKTVCILLSVIMIFSLFAIVPFTASAAEVFGASKGVNFSYRYEISLKMLPMDLFNYEDGTYLESEYSGITVTLFSESGVQLATEGSATMETDNSIWNTIYDFRFDTNERPHTIEITSQYFFTDPNTLEPGSREVRYRGLIEEGNYQFASNQFHPTNAYYEYFDFAEYSVSVHKIDYIKRHWDSQQKKVVSETDYIYGNYEHLSSLNPDEKHTLTGGWYLADGTTLNKRLTVDGEVNLLIMDGCTTNLKEGIIVNSGNTLNIYCQANESGKLDVFNSDNYCAGIGSEDGTACGTINIFGGTVVAKADDEAAGIGSGNEATGGNITIYGGNVTATGASYGAGIGGGDRTSGGNITIYDGTINATGGSGGAGIGGGDGGSSSGGTITINGGTITANGGDEAAGIGGGNQGSGNGGNITINDGTVTANGGTDYGAGIGGGDQQDGGNITINGGTVIATGGKCAAGIGGGDDGKSGKIIINNGNITVTGGTDGGSGIGTGRGCGDSDSTTVDITINGGSVNATAGLIDDGHSSDACDHPGAAIGAGGSGSGEFSPNYSYFFGAITFNGGNIIATNRDLSAPNAYYNDEIAVGGNKLGDTASIIVRAGVTLLSKPGKFNFYFNSNSGYYSPAFKAKTVEFIDDPQQGSVVIKNDNIYAKTNERVSYCTSESSSGDNTSILIQPCTHNQCEYVSYNEDIHVASCCHCTVYFDEAHDFIPVWEWNDTDKTAACTIKCQKCEFEDALDNVAMSTEIVTPYCTTNGNIKRIASVEYRSETYQDSKSYDVLARGFHNFGEPEWAWSDDFTEAIATLICDDCGEQNSAYARVSKEEFNDKTVYTSTALINGITYTDEKTVFSDGLGASVAGHSISLDGDIAVNFYMEISPKVLAHDGVYMQFTVPDTSKEYQNQRVYVKDLEPVSVNGKTYYVFKCKVAAKDMNSQIQAQLIDGDKASTVYKYSVREYAEYLLEHQGDSQTFQKAVPLVQAMLKYGDYAQNYFSNADALDALDVEIPAGEEVISNLPEGVSFEGATLSLKSQTSLSLYFVSEQDVTLSIDGKTEGVDYELAHNGNVYVIRIRNISAAELNNDFTVTVNGTGTVTYSPMTYCYKAANSQTANYKLKNVAKALYLYFIEADKYFNQGGN